MYVLHVFCYWPIGYGLRSCAIARVLHECNSSNFSPWYLMATLNWHVIDTCHVFFFFFFSSIFHLSLLLFSYTKFKKYFSSSLFLQPEKFVVESLFSSSPNLHGCNQQPPSPVHHHLRCYLVWRSPLLRPLSLKPSRASACTYAIVASNASHWHHHHSWLPSSLSLSL